MNRITNSTPSHTINAGVMATLNRNRIEEPTKKTAAIKAMGLSACQGLCITYNLHKKKFC